MSVDQFVVSRLGADKLTKLNHMHRGGKNNEKGNRLEDRFAVFKIITLATEAKSAEPQLKISKQAKGFVDDIVIEYPSASKKVNYQAKDVINISWGAFEENFRHQYIIDVEYHKFTESWTNALLAQRDQYEKLSKDVPESIKHHTACEFFPNTEALPALIMTHEPLREGLSALSKKKGDYSHYEAIFTQLLGQWGGCGNGLIMDLLSNAKKYADPDLFECDVMLDFDGGALAILDKIQNLSYSLDNDELNVCCQGMRLLLASSRQQNVKECELLILKLKPQSMTALVDIWKKLAKGDGQPK